MILLRYREGVGQRRETHLATDERDERVVTLCGQPFDRADIEGPEDVGDLPCVQCQLLSPQPDWAALDHVPYPPRLPFSNSGA